MMKQLRAVVVLSLCAFATAPSFATSFIVPDDEELVQKSAAIVTGVIVSAKAAEVEKGYIETRYEVALDRVLKGPFRSRTVITINSPGGTTEKRYSTVQSAAHFRVGEEVLLFLTPHRGGWTPTDMILGKFRFGMTTSGYSVAVRDEEDIAGWDRDGKVHKEKIRLEAEFLHFIEETVAGHQATPKYEVAAGEVLAPPADVKERFTQSPELFPAPATTYSVSFYTCTLDRYPGRWLTSDMTAGVNFFKNTSQNAAGLGDGGVSIIQNGLAAWTNDCESAVNIQYGGTAANLKDGDDNVNMVIFNDPGGHVPGTWGGSGVIAMTFSNGGVLEPFDGTDFVDIDDSDIVFQNGYAGTEASIEEAMTHEVGHGIGLRHSDKHYLQNCTAPGCVISCTESACDSGVEECSTSAIMTAAVIGGLNYSLQTWDQHGADRLYPGTCVAVNPPTNVVATATSTTVVNISWTASAGAATYNVYRSTDGTNYSLAGSTASTSLNDSGRTAGTSYLYKVRAVNGGESADSNRDLATTVIFTDDPLVAGTTEAKAVHITELRTAVNAVRTLISLGAGTYTDTITAGITLIKAVHITDLRTALDQARSALSLSAISYGESLTVGTTTIKASHINELRNGVK